MHAHAVWRYAVLLVAIAPLAYYLLASIAAWRFFSRERARQIESHVMDKIRKAMQASGVYSLAA